MAFQELQAIGSGSLTPAEQYRAAVEHCVWVDLSDRGQIEVTGGDRATFLHNFCTQEIKRLSVGSGCEAFVTNIKGRIIAHPLIFAGESAHWLDCWPGVVERLLPHLDRYIITEDVELVDRSAEWGEVALIGPRAGEVVDRLIPGSRDWPLFQHASHDGVTVRRFSFTRHPGWLVGGDPTRLATVCSDWIQAGIPRCSEEVFDALRIEAGFPRDGIDLGEDNLAHEAGRTRQAISFTKGCYLGQEPIARLEAMGHTNRELRMIRLSGSVVPSAGAKVVNPEGGEDWGTLTSAAPTPGEDQVVAMALLRREALVPGTNVTVVSDGEPISGEVAPLT